MSRFSRAWRYWIVALLVALSWALVIYAYRGIQILMAPIVNALTQVTDRVER